jgi:hypothetical protein
MQQVDVKTLQKVVKAYINKYRSPNIQLLTAAVGHTLEQVMGPCWQLCHISAEKEILQQTLKVLWILHIVSPEGWHRKQQWYKESQCCGLGLGWTVDFNVEL